MGYQMRVQGTADIEQSVQIERDFGGGTTQLCQAMVDLGMAFLSNVPEFPDDEHLDSTDFRGEQPVTARAHDYLAALERTRGEHEPAFLPGIPAHKLTSGDRWHVTADECSDALTSYAFAIAAGAAHPRAFGDDVLPFLRTASRFDGFRVS